MVKIGKELEKNGLILLILLTIGNGINYLYQIVMGRMLSVEDFGTLNALLSLSMMTAVPSGAITALITKYIVEYNTDGNPQLVGVFLYRSIKIVVIVFLFVALIGAALSPFIAQYLRIDTISIVALVMFLISLNLLLATTTGAVQGLKKFSILGLLNTLMPALKFSLSILFVLIGLGLFGTVFAIACAIIITLVVSIFYIRRKINIRNLAGLKLENSEYIKFFLSAFSLSACLAVLTNMDMVLIKHYLPQSEAGLYGPAMVLGRIVLYAPSALVQVMYPLVVEANVKAPNSTHKLILKVLFITSIIVGFCIFGLWISSNIALPLLFGDKYLGSVLYVLPASLFIVPICFLTVLMNFSMAVNNTKFLTFSMATGAILNFLLVALNHSNVYQILWMMTGVGVIIVLANMVSIGLEYRVFSWNKG